MLTMQIVQIIFLFKATHLNQINRVQPKLNRSQWDGLIHIQNLSPYMEVVSLRWDETSSQWHFSSFFKMYLMQWLSRILSHFQISKKVGNKYWIIKWSHKNPQNVVKKVTEWWIWNILLHLHPSPSAYNKTILKNHAKFTFGI